MVKNLDSAARLSSDPTADQSDVCVAWGKLLDPSQSLLSYLKMEVIERQPLRAAAMIESNIRSMPGME